MRRALVRPLTWLLLAFSLGAASSQQPDKSHVLVLNSYHQGLSWTDDTLRGIEAVLKAGDSHVELHMEFMDTKRFFDEPYLDLLARTYGEKYRRVAPAVVIAADNDAFDFVRRHRRDLFAGVPVVFCGINDYSDAMIAGDGLVTGVVEETDARRTIEVALRLHPKTEHIAVVVDHTTTGMAMKSEVLDVARHFVAAVDFVFLEDLEMSELQKQVASLPPRSVVLLTVFNYDRAGRFYTFEESLAHIRAAATVPIYGLWEFYLGRGIVGGMLTSGFQQGKAAGELALRVLRGEEAGRIPVIRKSPNRYMFDHAEMKRFSIAQAALPEDSVIVNLPDTLYSRYRRFIVLSLITFAFLSAIIFVLVSNISRRKRTEEALRESETKYRDLYDNAPDMYHSVDKNGIIVECNETEARILGYPKDEIVGRPIADFLTDASRTTHEKEFPAIIRMEAIQGLERDFVRKDGTTFTASLNVFVETDASGGTVKTKTIGRDISERKRAEAELRRSREDLRHLSAHVESAREEERGRIAREVHDELGVNLSKLKLDIAWLERRLSDQKPLLEKASSMVDLVDDTIGQVQRIASELRPGVLDHLGLPAAIRWQAGEFRDRAGIQCVLSILPEVAGLDQDLAIALFRIFQETLSNVVRHARATRVEVDLLEADGTLTLEVRDNGRGIAEREISDPASFGLMSIRERAAFFGGAAEIKGSPGAGTAVTVSIPLRRAEERGEGPARPPSGSGG
ncbi:MAG TPA: ABC transporter substrate binding protein [Anaeromyxobacteraceae bacterium]|nr:ABC transporter substrate binding protein [Anaeromyxobacteraceae bacterium]